MSTARIDRLNLVDEAVTLGTLPAFASVAGQMVATIKIIPFAAPRCDRALSCDRARSGPLVRIAPYRPSMALIQTRLPGSRIGAGQDRGGDRRAHRGAGGRLISEARCAHEIAALAERIRASGGDLVLIAGASAITDRRDVLPAAIEAAGGEVEHFGMPVDPATCCCSPTSATARSWACPLRARPS